MLKCPTTGYGFSLTSHPGRPGRYAGNVEDGSAAEAAGLVEGDRVVEVNGVNVNQENHKQVINRIKLVDHETKLLVVDKVCDQYHAERDIVLKSSLPYVVLLSSFSHTSSLSRETETKLEVIPCKVSFWSERLACAVIELSVHY
jgi:predicted metalloprotease with PDZ domain